MNKHRIIIGWLFVAMTMLLAVFLTFIWEHTFGPEGTPQQQQMAYYAIVVAALFLVVALTLILNYRHAAWICVPFSVAMLIYFPIGTVLGGYYLWYFWKFVYRKEKG